MLYVKEGRVRWRNLQAGADGRDSEVSLEDGESTANNQETACEDGWNSWWSYDGCEGENVSHELVCEG